MVMSLTELLNNTLSSISSTREDAVGKLNQYCLENFPQYLALLCQELANPSSGPHIRKSAGLMLKNCLVSKDPARQGDLSARWCQLDPTVRGEIKNSVLSTLALSDASSGTVTGQVVAAIAAIELPRGEWTEVVDHLLQVSTTTQLDTAKMACLETIGFICESIDARILQSKSNAILTAVATGARKEEPNVLVRLAAIQALHNAIDFVKDNFEVEGERNYIMQIVCEATQSEHSELQVAAFECLVHIVNSYYEKMEMYMQKALYGLTVLGMRHENEKVALQAVEFWSTVCEIEHDLELDIQEGAELIHHHFASKAAHEIVPVLLYLMTKQEEDDDEDEWNISMAAGTCLSLFAQCVQNDIVNHVLPFVETNIKNEDWRHREAAVMAFGSILGGPQEASLAPLVQMALPTLLNLMSDPVVHVRDSTVWTLSRICELMATYISEEQLQSVITVALNSLSSENPRIAANCAWCIINLSETLSHEGSSQATNMLSPYLEPFLAALNAVGELPQQDTNVRASVYEALVTLVRNCAQDCLPTIHKLTNLILERLNGTLAVQNQLVGADERRAHFEVQANLCSVLTSIIRRLGPQIAEIADTVMQTLLMVISNASKGSTVMEDAFIAVDALTVSVDRDFVRYMDSFIPFLHAALSNYEEHQLCTIAIGLVGDICRTLNEGVLPYCDMIMTLLGQILTNANAPRSIIPSCLSCLGDVALAITGKFEPYFHPAMGAILNLCDGLQYLPTKTDEQLMFAVSMREGIAEAFVGIAQGLKTTHGAILIEYAPRMFLFIEQCATDEDRQESVTRSVIGLVGDLAETLPQGPCRALFAANWIETMLREVKTNPTMSASTKEVGKWTREMIRRQI